MNEAEVAFYKHEDNIKLQENLVSFIMQRVLENASGIQINYKKFSCPLKE